MKNYHIYKFFLLFLGVAKQAANIVVTTVALVVWEFHIKLEIDSLHISFIWKFLYFLCPDFPHLSIVFASENVETETLYDTVDILRGVEFLIIPLPLSHLCSKTVLVEETNIVFLCFGGFLEVPFLMNRLHTPAAEENGTSRLAE